MVKLSLDFYSVWNRILSTNEERCFPGQKVQYQPGKERSRNIYLFRQTKSSVPKPEFLKLIPEKINYQSGHPFMVI